MEIFVNSCVHCSQNLTFFVCFEVDLFPDHPRMTPDAYENKLKVKTSSQVEVKNVYVHQTNLKPTKDVKSKLNVKFTNFFVIKFGF